MIQSIENYTQKEGDVATKEIFEEIEADEEEHQDFFISLFKK